MIFTCACHLKTFANSSILPIRKSQNLLFVNTTSPHPHVHSSNAPFKSFHLEPPLVSIPDALSCCNSTVDVAQSLPMPLLTQNSPLRLSRSKLPLARQLSLLHHIPVVVSSRISRMVAGSLRRATSWLAMDMPAAHHLRLLCPVYRARPGAEVEARTRPVCRQAVQPIPQYRP